MCVCVCVCVCVFPHRFGADAFCDTSAVSAIGTVETSRALGLAFLIGLRDEPPDLSLLREAGGATGLAEKLRTDIGKGGRGFEPHLIRAVCVFVCVCVC